MKKIIALFAANPTQDKVFQTSDGYNFWEESFADAHASRLQDKTVTPYTRSEVELMEHIDIQTDPVSDFLELLAGNYKPASAPVQEPTEEPVQEPTQEPAPAPAQEPAKEPAQEPTQEPAPAPAQEPAKEPAQEPTQEPAPAPAQEPAKPAAPKKPRTTKTETK